MNNIKKEIKSSQNINNNKSEANKLLIVDSILQKWYKLQKVIKEGLILKDVIIQQQKIDFNQLKINFIDYYNIKLKIRQVYEEIDNLKNNNKKYKKIFFKKNAEEIFLKSIKPISDLLFIFRNNYDYIIKLIELIENEDKNNNNNNHKYSIIELFCNQFYDNILIPNPEQEELLILIYKLIEKDISKMGESSIDQFLKENSFLCIFINYLMRKPELKIFLSRLLGPLILSIENENDELDISFFSSENINNNLNKNLNASKNEKENINTLLFNNIPKTKIKFKNFIELEEQKEKESKRTNSIQIDEITEETDIDNFENDVLENFNDEYKEDLSEIKINKKINEAKNIDLKYFYDILLEKIKDKPNIFNNLKLLSILKEENIKEKQEENVNKLKHSFLFIKIQIDNLLQSLIDKITAIPYILKCICKIISTLISLKFPSSGKYILNTFIGKFIFEKCIFPALNLENNSIMENMIFSSKTKDIIQIIINILSNAIGCKLFDSDNDPTKTIFNYYLIEIIPLLNEFYNKLIEVKFPNALNSLIKKRIKNKDSTSNYKTKLYKYFKENSDEILQLQCICPSIDDVLYIINLIDKNENYFENLKDSEKFYNSLNLIEKDILQEILNNEPDMSIFFVLFNIKYNSKLKNLLNENNEYYLPTRISKVAINEEELKKKRIKLCIKNILKGLNSINNKSYTYLNMATSNDIFFTLLKYSLEDIEELNIKNDNDNHQIPLKYYGQYINNNKKGLPLSYQENDYEKLYNEIIREESDNLKELNDLISIIISRDGMNLTCCEKIIEKTKNDLFHIEQSKKYVKIEKFIDNEMIEVCIRIKNKDINKEIEAKKKLQKKQQNKTSFFGFSKKTGKKEENIIIDLNPSTIIVTQDFSFCKHKNLEFIEKSKKNNVGCLIFNKRKLIPSHSYYIKDFIHKFSDNPWGEDIINQDTKPKDIITQDIIKGERNDQIYKTFQNYMNIIRSKLKSPSNINKNLFLNITEKECDNVIEIIENFIYRQIYKYIYPSESLKEDIDFYEKTKCLDWVRPKHLEIEKYYIEQLGMAELCIKNFDTARSIYDKLKYIKDAFTNINNNIKYSEGKNEEAGQDEMVPIFQYILIKAQPKRMQTNLNFINCFLSEEHLNGQFGYFISQIESSFSFIMNINYSQLNMSKEEFDYNYENAKRRHNIE